MELDSVTLEVLSRKLAAITDEMYFAVQRAARSSYVKEAADFATALLDPNGNVFAYPPSATFAFLIDTDFNSRADLASPHPFAQPVGAGADRRLTGAELFHRRAVRG